MNRFVDLHLHTFYSDGSDSPQQIVDKAKAAGLVCISITDHDTVEGVLPTQEIAQQSNLEVISGVELSTTVNGREVHLLGYLFDSNHPPLAEYLVSVRHKRVERIGLMVNKLNELGHHNIHLDEVLQEASSASVGRPHLASVMIKKGIVSGFQQAFDRYLADNAPGYVKGFKLDTYDAIRMIRAAGGVAVLAHPMVTLVDELILNMKEAGLGGIEVFYPNVSDNITHFYSKLAAKYNLVMTGGSDAHGDRVRHTTIGKVKVDYEVVEKLKAARGR